MRAQARSRGVKWSWALMQNWREVDQKDLEGGGAGFSCRIGGRWIRKIWREAELGSHTDLEGSGAGLS